ncbi:MAG TPA: SusC/RagA family TonB-linked outer membrane protein [Bacteroidales bacterium]|nr:SusC/RagA family TonB-linked outer membrane protein [Bacteroidales bacterium]
MNLSLPNFRKLGLLLLLIGIAASVSGQITIKGKVISADDNSLMPGVNVTVKGTTNGTMTGADGTFTLTVARKDDVLSFSYVGYTTLELNVGEKTTFEIRLSAKVNELESVVVMGYSNKKRNEITSAVTTVSSDKLMDVTSNDIGTMLQGKVAGIQVINGSGSPGSAPDIRIRGSSSFSAPNQGPLYVVDGIIGGTFDPNDVESLTVMKDAGATALYGSQANGGVIVVTTRKAKAGKPAFEVKAVTGFRIADQGHVTMMDSKTLYNYQREIYRDPVTFQIDDRKFLAARPASLMDVNTNWLKETFKPALVQNYFLSSSGQNDKLSYYIGASYYDENGTFINSYYKRLNLRANTSYKFSGNVTVTNNINISGSKTRGADYMNIYYAYTSMPWDNPYDSTGKPRSFKNADGIWSKDKINPVQAANNSELSNFGFSLDYDLDLDIRFTDWLSFSSTNRLSGSSYMDKQYYSAACDNLSYFGTGYVSSRNDISYGGISTDLLKFQFTKGIHSVTGLIGVEVGGDHSDYIRGSGTGIPQGLNVPTVASGQYSIEGAPISSVMQSFISQVNYIINNRYFFSGSFRIDQSSSFAPNKRTAMFPSLSAAWNINNEEFLKTISAINNLRLKVSWGRTGMKDIGPYKYMEQFRYATQYNGLPAAIPYQMANPNLTWEQTGQLNLGLEAGFLQRINIDFNVYRNLTDNLLVYRDLPPSGGFRKQWQNIGKSENRGVELSVSTVNIKSQNLKWTTDFNIGYNKNTLSGFGTDTIQNANTYGIVQIYHNGGSLYSWYAKEYYGIDPANGSMLWVGKDGQPTHDYQAARKVESGTPMPKFQGGFGTELAWKGLSVRANFSFVSGNRIYNYFRRYVDHDLQDVGFNVMMPRSDWKIWQQPGDIANHPLPQNAINSYDPSTRYIEDGSYIKVRNVTLSYEIPARVLSGLKLTGLTLSVGADNLYTFTRFWGQDPEVSINPANGLPGYAEFKYPNNRQFICTLNVRF